MVSLPFSTLTTVSKRMLQLGGKMNIKTPNARANKADLNWLRCIAYVLVAGLVSACEAPDDGDGQVINQLALPSDVILKLACEDAGVHPETCVLADPENPFVTTTITEFNVNNPDAGLNKFDLANALPPGPAGAKARYYFWATALARFPSGENQYYTAVALHELFDANSNDAGQDELARTQALKAYRSVLDNFFESATVFTCCANLSPDGQPVAFPVAVRNLAADAVHRTDRTGYRRLIEGDPLLAIERLLDWGYIYQPGTSANNFDDGLLTQINSP